LLRNTGLKLFIFYGYVLEQCGLFDRSLLRIAILLPSFFTAKLAKKKNAKDTKKKMIAENENGNNTIG
jgi:hypothetical protein